MNSLSITAEEDQQIKDYMQRHNLKRHQVLKLALRNLLFPYEKEQNQNKELVTITDN